MSDAIRLIVGCGYVGKATAAKWISDGDRVLAITRSHARFDELSSLKIEPIVWDWQLDGRDFDALGIDRFDSVLISVSHAPSDGVPLEVAHPRGLRNLFNGLAQVDIHPDRAVYLSTTGVFRERFDGGWVDETSDVSPTRPGSIAALAGEDWIRANCPVPHVVLRPAGIYGPGRLPRWQSIRDQEALHASPTSYLNLIHVDDLAEVIKQVTTRPIQSNLFCVSDGNPVLRGDYYQAIADMGGWPKPRFVSDSNNAPTHENRLSRSDGNKRVDSTRLRNELQLQLKYPTYLDGLRNLLPTIPR